MLISIITTENRDRGGRHAGGSDSKSVTYTVTIEGRVNLKFNKVNLELTNIWINYVDAQVAKVLSGIGLREARIPKVDHLISR